MYAVLNMGYTPSQWIKLGQKERAFVIAAIQIKLEEEKRQLAKSKAKTRTSKARRR